MQFLYFVWGFCCFYMYTLGTFGLQYLQLHTTEIISYCLGRVRSVLIDMNINITIICNLFYSWKKERDRRVI